MSTEIDKAITEADAAERLCVSTDTLRRWRRSGTFPVTPLPGMSRKIVRYSERAIQRYLEGAHDGHGSADLRRAKRR